MGVGVAAAAVAGGLLLVPAVRRVEVEGGSMVPALRPGDRLVVVGRSDGRFVILHDQTDDSCDPARRSGDCACGEDLQIEHKTLSPQDFAVCP